LRQDVLNDRLTADQLLSVLVKNGILNQWERNYRNFQCIEEDDYHDKVMEDLVNLVRYILTTHECMTLKLTAQALYFKC
jgi:hypothetical protein